MPAPGDPTIRGAQTTRLYGVAQQPKTRCVTVRQGQCAAVKVALGDESGDAYDLTAYNDADHTVVLVGQEALRRDPGTRFQSTGIISTPATGLVTADIPRHVANNSAIYICEAGITDDTDYPRAQVDGEVVTTLGAVDALTYQITTLLASTTRNYSYPGPVTPLVSVGSVLVAQQQLVKEICLVWSSPFYLYVLRGLFGDPEIDAAGPPTPQEVHDFLRDFPEGNRLLDEYEFDLAEVAQAAVRCVQYYNDQPPPSEPCHDTRNFPYRYQWLEGIISELFRTASHWHRRNALKYQAGGVVVEDIGKQNDYLQASELHGKAWREFVRQTKVRRNAEAGFGIVGSAYGSFW